MSVDENMITNKESLERELREVIEERRVTDGEDYYGITFKNHITGKTDVEIAIGWDNYKISQGSNASCELVLDALSRWLPEEYEVGKVLTELLVEYLGTEFHCYEHSVNSVFLIFPTALVMIHHNAKLN